MCKNGPNGPNGRNGPKKRPNFCLLYKYTEDALLERVVRVDDDAGDDAYGLNKHSHFYPGTQHLVMKMVDS